MYVGQAQCFLFFLCFCVTANSNILYGTMEREQINFPLVSLSIVVVTSTPGEWICWDPQMDAVSVQGSCWENHSRLIAGIGLLITDTVTFKAVSLSVSVERSGSCTTSCQPHMIMASTRLLQTSARNKESKNVGQLKDRNLEKILSQVFSSSFNSPKAKQQIEESRSHFLLSSF